MQMGLEMSAFAGPQSVSRQSARHRFSNGCACCEITAVPANPARRNFLAGGIAALGLAGDCRIECSRSAAGRGAAGGAEIADRCASSLSAAGSRRGDEKEPRRRTAAVLVCRTFACRYGKSRRDDSRAVADAAGRLVRQCRRSAQSLAPMQRLRRAIAQRLSGQVRPVRRHSAARHRRQPARNRICARRAQGRRHRAVHELWRQISRRSRLRAGVRRAQSPQGGGLYASDNAGLLHKPDQGRVARRHRIRHRHDAHHREPDLRRRRHGIPLPGYPFHLVAQRRHAAVLDRAPDPRTGR